MCVCVCVCVGASACTHLPRLAIHDQAAREPHLEDVVLGELLGRRAALQREQRRLGLLVPSGGGAGDGVVVEEGRVGGEVGLDGREVDEHVVELAKDEEAARHALPAGDGIALARRGAEQLKVLLGDLEVLARVHGLPENEGGTRVSAGERERRHRRHERRPWQEGATGTAMAGKQGGRSVGARRSHLADGEVGDALENVLLRRRRRHVLHQLKRLLHLAVMHVVDDQVEPRLGHQADERREDL